MVPNRDMAGCFRKYLPIIVFVNHFFRFLLSTLEVYCRGKWKKCFANFNFLELFINK
jgi:hypothetical protein